MSAAAGKLVSLSWRKNICFVFETCFCCSHAVHAAAFSTIVSSYTSHCVWYLSVSLDASRREQALLRCLIVTSKRKTHLDPLFVTSMLDYFRANIMLFIFLLRGMRYISLLTWIAMFSPIFRHPVWVRIKLHVSHFLVLSLKSA